MVPIPLALCIMRTSTTLWYRYHLRVFAHKTLDFCIFIHFSSTNLLQSIPYRKSTMESTQNNSKGGLESMKTLFCQVRAFSQIENHKKMRLGFDFLTLASSNLLFQVVRSLMSKKWEQSQPKLDLLQTLALSPIFSFLSLPKT